ncbi:MAG: hypothetical protein JSW00_19145 [Thermoplasmata archaeon]|nr:MAG: hypothetical protein JSW00_19145 [Thermoplasmata archaeon]
MLCVFDSSNILIGNVAGDTIYVNETGSNGAYDSIQDAITAGFDGDTIFVYSGRYYEDVVVNKRINLTGEDRNITIIDGVGGGNVVFVSAPWVNITGFTIENGSCGINVTGDNCCIYGNIIKNITGFPGTSITEWYIPAGDGNVGSGIYLDSSEQATIHDNNISSVSGGRGGNSGHWGAGGTGGTGAGIYLRSSSNNRIFSNIIFNMTGGKGGTGGNYAVGGGCGGIGTGIYLKQSLRNNISSNTISAVNGGEGEVGGLSSSNGADQVGFGIFIEENSFDNEIFNTNTVDGDPVVYYYNKTGVIIDNYILEADSNPTNLGKIVCIECMNIEIKNNIISNFTGMSQETGDYDQFITPGGLGTGIYLFLCEQSNASYNNISLITGGTGGTVRIDGGNGGIGTGIYLKSCTGNDIFSNNLSSLHGGAGGNGGYQSAGGSGGISAGIYLLYSTNNNLISNIIPSSSGGLGGLGGRYSSGGEGGVGCGIYINSSIKNNISTNTISNVNGGAGAAGGFHGSPGASQVGFGIYIHSDSLNNSIMLSNTLDGDPIVYRYNETDVLIENYVLLANSNPTNFGKIACINCHSITVQNNEVANYHGMGAETWEFRQHMRLGGMGTGIYLRSVTHSNITSNTVSFIFGGTGGTGEEHTAGGTGGVGAGIYLLSSSDNNISSNVISSIEGGKGGRGGNDATGGTGGMGVGFYFQSSTNNNISSNTLTSITGGLGGNEGQSGDYKGNNQVGFGLFIDQDSLDNKVETTNIIDGDAIIYYYSQANITIEGYSLEANSNPTNYGKIALIECDNITIKHNVIANYRGLAGGNKGYHVIGENGETGCGINLRFSTNITLVSNIISSITGGEAGDGGYEANGGIGGTGVGIYLYYSNLNYITTNTLSSVTGGTGGVGGWFGSGGRGGLGVGLYMESSWDFDIVYNSISSIVGGAGGKRGFDGSDGSKGNGICIYLKSANNNLIKYNNVSSSDYGIYLESSESNKIFNNNLIGNTNQGYDNGLINKWNTSYPTGGNYFNDYSGADEYKGPGQDIWGSDGIGDSSYIDIGGGTGNQDYYPLMYPYNENTIFLCYGWNLISIPYIQTNTDLNTVLASIAGSYDAVQWYNATDANDPWKHHHISKPSHLNDLGGIDNTMGFWIHITEPSGILFEFYGLRPTESQQINLHLGWNLVAYPSLTSYNRTKGLNNINFDTQINLIMWYDAYSNVWQKMGENDLFRKGQGYYIHSKEDVTWNVPL